VNPFATEEDDDSDGEDGDFTIGDLEAEEGGKGHLPPTIGLVGNEESRGDLSKNVGILPNASVLSSSNNTGGTGARVSFPSLWPFGNNSLKGNSGDFAVGDKDRDAEDATGCGMSDRNHFRGASANDGGIQSSDDSDDSDEEGYGHSGVRGMEFGDGKGRVKRRLSVTTEAKRRTSLEDDDEDEEVVHVAMAEAQAEGKGISREGEDDGELVEIQHAEMQGVETESEK